MNAHLDFLLSVLYDAASLHPLHLADLRKSGLADATIRQQKIRTVPPHMIDVLLGFLAPGVTSAYLIPFPDPRGSWMDHVRVKVFPSIETESGTIKYLQPKHSGVRVYFPITTLERGLYSTEALYLIEGEKKSLAVAQLGLPAIGICGIEGWHRAGSIELLEDFADIPLRNRIVDIIPDGDVETNPDVRRGTTRLMEALARRGAEPRAVILPVAA
jgi:hypothetical protein